MLQQVLHAVVPSRLPAPALPDPSRRMCAVVLHAHGPPDALQFESDVAAPARRASQVLVAVHAAGINPLDCKMRKGPIASFLYPKPKICGLDVAGTVVEAPEGSEFCAGDRVFAMLPLLGTPFGAYASLCCVEEALLARAPENVDLVGLASLPLVACTVIQALRPVVEAFAGDVAGRRCFVQAASGGLGSFAVQYCARALGMTVVASCSARHAALVRSLGATSTFDSRVESLDTYVRDMDVFFDSLGYLNEDAVWAAGSAVMRRRTRVSEPPSHYIRIASSPLGSDAMGHDPFGLAVPEARVDRMITGYAKQLLHSHWTASTVRPVVSHRFPLAEAAQAHSLLERGGVTGKIVLEVPQR